MVALLLFAVVRLVPLARAALEGPLGPLEWAGIAASLLFLGYVEGYKAFQKAFAPRVVVRGFYLAANPRPLWLLTAPLFCMCHVHARRGRLIASWAVTLGVVALVLIVGRVPQPWRGIIDLGVVVALGWGALAIVAMTARTFAGRPLSTPLDLPVAAAPGTA